ncbi:hypothetical protein [Vibrio alginolyticus]|uniref:hypothetical protein n=1 Tax=Vibrio TaxID=662 RepID=UPI0006CA6739|nr:hypothetical protein [Vibrio alginolyticus]KPM97554.1 hypothetical protein AOG25_13880 [Vibrio alginolyticus]
MTSSKKLHYDDVVLEKTSRPCWKTESGQLINDEHNARWSECTHVTCKVDGCDEIISKSSTTCASCSEAKKIEKWNSAKKVPFDNSYLYSDKHDEYFKTIECLKLYADDHMLQICEMRVYLCKPNYPDEIDIENLIENARPEDMYADELLDNETLKALAHANELLKNHKAISHSPDYSRALKIDDLDKEMNNENQ